MNDWSPSISVAGRELRKAAEALNDRKLAAAEEAIGKVSEEMVKVQVWIDGERKRSTKDTQHRWNGLSARTVRLMTQQVQELVRQVAPARISLNNLDLNASFAESLEELKCVHEIAILRNTSPALPDIFTVALPPPIPYVPRTDFLDATRELNYPSR